jgi:hypothetical protein
LVILHHHAYAYRRTQVEVIAEGSHGHTVLIPGVPKAVFNDARPDIFSTDIVRSIRLPDLEAGDEIYRRGVEMIIEDRKMSCLTKGCIQSTPGQTLAVTAKMRGRFLIIIQLDSPNRLLCLQVIFIKLLKLHENHRHIWVWNKVC